VTDDFERARAAGRDRRDHVEADAAAEHIEYELRRERRLARDAREIVRHTMTVFGVFTGGIGCWRGEILERSKAPATCLLSTRTLFAYREKSRRRTQHSMR